MTEIKEYGIKNIKLSETFNSKMCSFAEIEEIYQMKITLLN
jgi:hypothetical protein